MATLVRRFDPFRELASLQNDMRRMIYAEGDGEHSARAWIPALDVWESERVMDLTRLERFRALKDFTGEPCKK